MMAVSLGLSSIPSPFQVWKGPPDTTLMTKLPWLIIPGFLVPSLLTLHAMIFFRLLTDKPQIAGAKRGSKEL